MNFFDKNSPFYNYFYIKELLIILFALLMFSIIKSKRFLKYVLIVFILIIVFFFRNNLDLPSNLSNNSFISPSSSKIITINKVGNNYEILTYLSPLDRHFMVAPVDCKVTDIKKLKLQGDAERTRVTFLDKNNNIFSLDQIVKKPMQGIGVFGGWVPKLLYKNRVVTTCKVGDTLKKGERWGLIRFGSNMFYKIPETYDLKISEKQYFSIGEIMT